MNQPFVVVVPVAPMLAPPPFVIHKPIGDEGVAQPEPPNFFIQLIAGGRKSAFTPMGFARTANELIDFHLLGESTFDGGQVVASNEWKSVGTATIDQYGMFGFNSGALKFLLQRTVPGPPPQWLERRTFWRVRETPQSSGS